MATRNGSSTGRLPKAGAGTETTAEWIWETERLIEEMKAAPSDPGIDWVRGMLEEAVERKRRLLGFSSGRIH